MALSVDSQMQLNQLLYPVINKEPLIIPIWLRDTYVRTQPDLLYELNGFNEENRDTEIAAIDSLSQGITKSDLFLSGGDVFIYLNRNLDHEVCSQTINIIIRNLHDLYWTNRDTLSEIQIRQLEIALKQPLPTFKNIFEYKSLDQLRNTINMPMFQLFGTITPFNVIYVPVIDFIESINKNEPIRAILPGTDIIIELHYQPYDFWDFDTNSLINHIDIESRCNV